MMSIPERNHFINQKQTKIHAISDKNNLPK